MKDYSKQACENFKKGYNCAQSVILAFADDLKIDKMLLSQMASSFGGGMGRLREVCGAVSAMFIIAGIKSGYSTPETGEIKATHYKLIQDLAEEFKKEHGTIICRELLGELAGEESHIPSERTEQYYTTRPCEKCIENAAKIIEKYFYMD